MNLRVAMAVIGMQWSIIGKKVMALMGDLTPRLRTGKQKILCAGLVTLRANL